MQGEGESQVDPPKNEEEAEPAPGEKDPEVELEEARHKARVAEIEAELASERLRRSRQV